MMTVDELTKLQLQHYVKAAQNYESKSLYEAGAAEVAYEKAVVEKKTAELLHRRVQNASRPSIYLGAFICREENGYRASFAELTAYGDTPEQAFDNFDRLWVQGDGV